MSSPSGSGRSPAAKRFLVHFQPICRRILASIFKQLVLSKITILTPPQFFQIFPFRNVTLRPRLTLSPPPTPISPFPLLPNPSPLTPGPLPPLLFPPFPSLLYISSMTCQCMRHYFILNSCFCPSFLFSCVIFSCIISK